MTESTDITLTAIDSSATSMEPRRIGKGVMPTKPGSAHAAVATGRATMIALIGLTFSTGLIDAVSFISLGHVFTANMTGNIVLLGFAVGGAKGLSVARSAFDSCSMSRSATANVCQGSSLTRLETRLPFTSCSRGVPRSLSSGT